MKNWFYFLYSFITKKNVEYIKDKEVKIKSMREVFSDANKQQNKKASGTLSASISKKQEVVSHIIMEDTVVPACEYRP